MVKHTGDMLTSYEKESAFCCHNTVGGPLCSCVTLTNDTKCPGDIQNIVQYTKYRYCICILFRIIEYMKH